MADQCSDMHAAKSADSDTKDVDITVCFATSIEQFLISLKVPANTTIEQAVHTALPQINLSQYQVGIFGKLQTPDTVLREHDRVEIYRPLQADPKESRRRRALHKKSG